MKASKILLAAALGLGGFTAGSLLDARDARAQSATTGAIQGVVADSRTGEKLAGVTVTVTSPSLQGAQTAITDENGFFKITELPPGEYLITYYYLEITVERSGVTVGVNKTTPGHQKLDQTKAGGETVKIEDAAPTIDPTSTAQGITIDKNYIKNIPVPGRTFESALGAAAGSSNDGSGGVSFSGSSGVENQYYVDGVNTTGLTYGTVGSPIINDFIEEIEVITGGYNAEYGRSTGAVVNVVTKTGSNEFKGSIFGYWQPGQLTASVESTPSNASSIDVTTDNALDIDFGFELGGPIIKDKLWFFVGFAPQFQRLDITRTVKRRTDCRQTLPDGSTTTCDPTMYADSIEDVDPQTGFFYTDSACGGDGQPSCEVRTQALNIYSAVGKINYAANPENQGQLAVSLLPAQLEAPGVYGPVESGTKLFQLTSDVSLKWTSKFNDNKTELEAVVGWHRDQFESDPYEPTLASRPRQILSGGTLNLWGRGGLGTPERAENQATCYDMEPGAPPPPAAGVVDPYPTIKNCPMDTVPYVIGGPGSLRNNVEQRRAAKIGITQRLKAAGSHEIKAGIDVENNLSDKARLYSGGAFLENILSGNNQFVVVTRWVQLAGRRRGTMGRAPEVDPMGRFDNVCRTPNVDDPGGGNLEFICDYLSGEIGAPGTQVTGNTLNWSAYLRDSWQIRPNLTLNAGLRYEEQRLRFSSELQNKTDPLTGVELGKNAMTLTGMFAPRIGLLYDWTKEGRSKVYGSWGRFYESIPMDINDRAFGGETNFQQVFVNPTTACQGMRDPNIGGANGEACLTPQANGMDRVGQQEQLFGASGVLVAPGIESQYMDEIILGFEYELIDDLKVGVAYKNRSLGRVIEDVSTDGANTYLIANPGQFDAGEEKKLEERVAVLDQACMAEGPSSPSCDEHARLSNHLEMFRGIRIFDKPRRDHNALEFTLTRRFSKKLYVQGSYTYSRTEGNYGGLYSADNGQLDPNISSQYDLIELLANRVGPLPQDRPHYIKLDGYYTFDFKKAGALTVGARLRALSGIPTNALAGHYLYGSNESFLLPRGQLGRTDFEHGLDMQFGYAYDLGKGRQLEFILSLYNIYNRQGTFGVDDTYAPRNTLDGDIQNANPVSGGTYEDLIWVKAIDRFGDETPNPISRNPNFRNTNSRYGPAYGRIGVRLTF